MFAATVTIQKGYNLIDNSIGNKKIIKGTNGNNLILLFDNGDIVFAKKKEMIVSLVVQEKI